MTAQIKPPGRQQQLLYSRKQVARLLGNVSIATVRRLEKEGRLRRVRLAKNRGNVFFRASDIDAFLNEVADVQA